MLSIVEALSVLQPILSTSNIRILGDICQSTLIQPHRISVKSLSRTASLRTLERFYAENQIDWLVLSVALFKKAIPSVSFVGVSLIDTTSRNSIPLCLSQFIKKGSLPNRVRVKRNRLKSRLSERPVAHLTLSALDLIDYYSLRFQIEFSLHKARNFASPQPAPNLQMERKPFARNISS